MSEQFENSIRKKLQEADIPFDPDAWAGMEKRLDDTGRRRSPLWWWMGGLLLLLSVGGIWWLSSSDKPASPATENRMPVTDSASASAAHHVDKQQSSDPASGDKPQHPITASPVGTGDADNSGTTGSAEKHLPNAAAIHTVQAGGKTTALTGRRNNQLDNSGRTQEAIVDKGVDKEPAKTVATTADKAPGNLPPSQPAANTARADSIANHATAPQAAAPPTPGKTIVDNPARDTTSSALAKALPKAKKSVKRRFDAGISMGPDFNVVSSMKHGRIGFGAGLLLRYHISNSFYLGTGAAYTKKLYGADDKDYYSPYPTNYKKIDADCNVLDIPLNIHYNFLQRPKHSWSVMAGASSYLMLKERYEYYTNSGGKYDRVYDNKNQHYFSVLNIGVGYERRTGGIIKWGVQPYLKFPLGGVGAGKVNLYSAGISLQATVGKKE